MMQKKLSLPPFLVFLLGRIYAAVITLLVVTALIYAIVLMVPVEARAAVYLPDKYKPKSDAEIHHKLDLIIKEYDLDGPYPVQYVRWLGQMLQGEWGWSPNLQEYVLDALLSRTPSTIELMLFSVLLYLPLGLIAGAYAGWRKGSRLDRGFRLSSFLGISIPPFILGIVLLSIFYAALGWFPPGNIDPLLKLDIRSESFHVYTGLLTLDGLLNRRFDITLDALRHLTLPAISLSLVHWATLGLITRSAMIEEIGKEYLLRAKAFGLSNRRILWRHAFRNALLPGLTSSALSAASLLTGVYVIEVIFNRRGVSELIAYTLINVKGSQVEASLPIGFAVYNVFAILAVMFLLDIVHAISDPRIQMGET